MARKSKNVCKFAIPRFSEQLKILHFVLEENADVMKAEVKLKNHVAYMLIEGQGDFIFGETRFEAAVGTLIFGFEGEQVSVMPSEDLKYLYIGFEGGRAEELFSRYGVNKIRRAFGRCESLIPLWYEGLLSAEEDSIDIVGEATLLYAFSRISRDSAALDIAINRALDIVEDNFDDSDFTLSALAEILGYNPKYLSQLFKKRFGQCFNDYLRNVRIKHAVFLLNHGINSVKNVAYLCGFSDSFYFSTVFKRVMGVSPKAYKSGLEE